jgi:hypothetical protein
MTDGHSLPQIGSIDSNVADKVSTRRLFVKRAVASMLFSASVDGLKGSRAYGATARSSPLGQLPRFDGELVGRRVNWHERSALSLSNGDCLP